LEEEVERRINDTRSRFNDSRDRMDEKLEELLNKSGLVDKLREIDNMT
jgi:hypothetical protein